MSKEIFSINGKLYFVDDETGEIKTIELKTEQIPPRDLAELMKILMKRKKD